MNTRPSLQLANPPAIPAAYRQPIQLLIQQVYQHLTWTLQEDFGIHDLPLLIPADLLLTPFADELALLARAAAGELQHDDFGDGVLMETIQSICEILFANPVVAFYEIPESFWTSPIGAMIARAQLWLRRDQLITLKEAADLLGLKPPSVTAMTRDGRLTVYVDPDAPNPTRSRRLVSRVEVLTLVKRAGV
jgi:hypothetical protein